MVKIPLTPYHFPHVVEGEPRVPVDPGDPYAEMRQSFDRIARGRSEEPAGAGAAVFLATTGGDSPSALGLPLPWLDGSLRAGMAVLDVGCGVGRDLLGISRRVGADGFVAGIDLSPEMIRAARASLSPGADLRVALAEAPPFEDDSFDAVVMNCCLGLVLDRQGTLEQAHRVMRSHGVLHIADAVTLSDLQLDIAEALRGWGNAVGDAIAAQVLRTELEDAGFEVERWRVEPLDRQTLMDGALMLSDAPTAPVRALIERFVDELADRVGRVFVAAKCRPRA